MSRDLPLRVLIWDPLAGGHHRVWLRMLLETAPFGIDPVVPTWFEGAHASSRPSIGDEVDPFADLRRAVDESAADVALVPDLRPFLVPRSPVAAMPDVPLVAIDHGSDHVRFREEQFRRMGLRRSASTLRHLIWREILVRRARIQIFSTHPLSTSVGSNRLRSSTVHLSMPIEEVSPVAASPWLGDRHQRLLLVGALQPRKGLDLLVEALETPLLEESRILQDLEVVVAGKTSRRYRPQARRLIDRLRFAGVHVRFVDRYLQDDEYSALLLGADVVALPYDRFLGGSGILGTLLDKGPSVVTSDYGWMGRYAREAGAYTYADGDSADLARSLLEALEYRRPVTSVGTAFLSKETALSPLWDAVVEEATR